MIKTYLINLDRSPQRLEFMRAQYEPLRLAVERIAAVDGAKLDLAPYAGSRLTPGEIGCFLSHRAAWERLVSSGDSHALVLEDDVRLASFLPRLLVSADWIPPSARIVKLDSSGRRVATTRSRTALANGYALHGLLSEHTGGAGYILSRSAALALIERAAVVDQPVDVLLFGADAVERPRCGILQLSPAAVAQEKRLVKALRPGLESLILAERLKLGPTGLRRVWRNLADGVLKAGTLVAQQYRSRVADIQYLRVPFILDP